MDIKQRKELLDRDNHKCQNILCNTPESKITNHHIKFKKNGGKDTLRNRVAICAACQSLYHKGRISLKFDHSDNLPPHIKGHTFKIHNPDDIDWETISYWKKTIAEMKTFRKGIKEHWGTVLSGTQIMILMRFLTFRYKFNND